jgi:hypothetical protein
MTDKGGLRKRGRQGTFIPRALLRDNRLSFRSKGLIAYLLDKPRGWEVRSEALAAESGHERRDAILTALREAGSCGYYRIERRRGKDGKFYMGTAISEEAVPEWAADFAEYGGKPVPVVWKEGRYWVRHKDGTLTSDGFDGYEDEDLDPDDEPPPAEGSDDLLFPQVSPCPENPDPGKPVPVQPGPEQPGPGSAGPGQSRAIRRTDDEEPKRSSSRTEPASQSQYGGPEGRSPSGPKPRARASGGNAKGPDGKAIRTPEEQAIFDKASEVAQQWWNRLKGQNLTIVKRNPNSKANGFVGLRDSLVAAALAGGATSEHVWAALEECGVPFPLLQQFQRALTRVQAGLPSSQPGRPARGSGRPPAAQVDARTTPQQLAELDDLWEGVSVGGVKVSRRKGTGNG